MEVQSRLTKCKEQMLQATERLKEAQLLRRIRSGDDSAFVETYDLFAPKIWRHVLYRTGSGETADDIMSDTFLRAWEYVRSKAKEIEHLRAFLYRIANNLVVDHYRRRAKAAIPIDEDLERTLGADDGLDDRLDLGFEKDRMRRALLELRTEVRELLVMRFVDDLSIEEIAVTTGRSKNAVYVAIHRAIKELKTVCVTTR